MKLRTQIAPVLKYFVPPASRVVAAPLSHRATMHLATGLLLAAGVTILALGMSHGVIAEDDGLTIQYNDVRFAEASNAILSYLEGSFGALVMVVAGLVAIISAAFGQYRAAMGCLIIAVGAFILRSFISTFFNDGNIMQ